MEDKNEYLEQMEFITNYPQNTKVELNGENLIGDIDFMSKRTIILYPTDAELKSLLTIKTSIFSTDTSGSTVEGETELIVNVYNYEQNLGVYEIYGLICYATIFNYMTITNAIREKSILHDGDFYKPTVIIPSFQAVENDIIIVRNKAYGL